MKKNKAVQIVILVSFLITMILLFIACQKQVIDATPEPVAKAAPIEEIVVKSAPPLYYYSVRAFLLPNTDINYDFGAFGYLILERSDKERDNMVCRAFMEKMKSINEPGYRVKAEESPKSLMPTYWLLKQEPEEREKEMNCAQDEQDCDNHCNLYVKYYDDTRADEMAQELEIYTAGPILVAFKMPYEYYQFHRKKPEEYLKFDLSVFSAEDMERAIRIWQKRIAENPEMWDKGFMIEKIREACQNFLNEYGSKILAVIKID